jgi:uncharacterized protein YoxC
LAEKEAEPYMIIEIEIGIIALAAIVLVAFFVPLLIQLRKTVEESERLLKSLQYDLPNLLNEAAGTAQVVNRAASDVQEATERAKVLGQAMGAIGDTVNQIHGAIRTKASSLVLNATGLVAGVRAAVHVLGKGRRWNHPAGGSGPEI